MAFGFGKPRFCKDYLWPIFITRFFFSGLWERCCLSPVVIVRYTPDSYYLLLQRKNQKTVQQTELTFRCVVHKHILISLVGEKCLGRDDFRQSWNASVKNKLSGMSWLVQRRRKNWCDFVSSHGAWCINWCVHRKKKCAIFLHTNQYLQKNVQWESEHLMHYLERTSRCFFFLEQFEPHWVWEDFKKCI